jgi:antitoxin (DNA-binding transcriptional repressor) of toxin-antitoxin stability system
MKTATIRDLRYDFSRVEAWIRNGSEIELTRHGRPIARITPLPRPAKTKLVKPDIMARLKETWGDRIFSAKEVAEMRAAELEGEEG